MDKKVREIRFITPDYKELYRINDGEYITIESPVSGTHNHKCKYLDDYHFETSGRVWHICEFAEYLKATPLGERLTALYAICLHLFRHIAQKTLDIRQYACGFSAQSDEKSDCASDAQSPSGIALKEMELPVKSLKTRRKKKTKKDRREYNGKKI